MPDCKNRAREVQGGKMFTHDRYMSKRQNLQVYKSYIWPEPAMRPRDPIGTADKWENYIEKRMPLPPGEGQLVQRFSVGLVDSHHVSTISNNRFDQNPPTNTKTSA